MTRSQVRPDFGNDTRKISSGFKAMIFRKYLDNF